LYFAMIQSYALCESLYLSLMESVKTGWGFSTAAKKLIGGQLKQIDQVFSPCLVVNLSKNAEIRYCNSDKDKL